MDEHDAPARAGVGCELQNVATVPVLPARVTDSRHTFTAAALISNGLMAGVLFPD